MRTVSSMSTSIVEVVSTTGSDETSTASESTVGRQDSRVNDVKILSSKSAMSIYKVKATYHTVAVPVRKRPSLERAVLRNRIV